MHVNVAAVVEERSVRHPDRAAITFGGRTYSYADLEMEAARAANAFAALGVRQGDRVALQLPNLPAYVWCYLGALKLGAIVVSVNPGLTPGEAGFVLRDSGASVLITTAAGADTVEAAGVPRHVLVSGDGAMASLERALAQSPARRDAVRVPPDTPAAILYTSGTTGTPKGATLSHGNVLFVAAAKQRYLQIVPDDRVLLFLPLVSLLRTERGAQRRPLRRRIRVPASGVRCRTGEGIGRGRTPDGLLRRARDVRAAARVGTGGPEPGAPVLLGGCAARPRHRGALARALWTADSPGLRPHRDVTVCQLQPPERLPAGLDRHRHRRHRDARRGRRERAAGGAGRHRRGRDSRSERDARLLEPPRRNGRRAPRAAGSTPATSGAWTPTATFSSKIG